MPGLAGIVCANSAEQPQKLLREMLRSLKDEEWYQIDAYHESGLGLGRATLGLINAAPQPVWNKEHTLCILMEGELFDSGHEGYARKNPLSSYKGNRQEKNDARYMLELYEQEGESFVRHLNGAFVAGIWDSRQRMLTLLNDRLALFPLYYFHSKRGLLFASGLRAFLVDEEVPRQIDKMGLLQFLTFDYPLQDRTLLDGIKWLRPASRLIFQNGNLKIQSYWKPQFSNPYHFRKEEEYLEETTHLLRQACKRQASGSQKAGVLLSGGLDSRLVVAFLQKLANNGPLHSFTFGIPGCDDARYASQVAARLGVEHHGYELRADYLLKNAEKAVRITDGHQNCVHMHALATLGEETKHASIFYKGFLGDTLLGSSIDHKFWGNYAADEMARIQLEILRAHNFIVFDENELSNLLSQEYKEDACAILFESYREVLADLNTNELADQFTLFHLSHRAPRLTLHGVELVRTRGCVRLPYCDNDFVDFVLTVPPGFRMRRYLSEKVLSASFPELAKIPHTQTGHPLSPCLRGTLMQLNFQLRWRLRKAGLNWIPVRQARPYADYASWFRSALRPWVEEILLSPSCLERGYFKPEYIRRLLARHMAGENHEKKLGSLLTLELWHRQFFDQ